jgi:hypothetical protein
LTFGNRTRKTGAFFSNHTVSVSESFQAGSGRGEGVGTVDIPFSYTPNGHGTPAVQISGVCTRLRVEGDQVTGKNQNPPIALPSGSFGSKLFMED